MFPSTKDEHPLTFSDQGAKGRVLHGVVVHRAGAVRVDVRERKRYDGARERAPMMRAAIAPLGSGA